MDSLVILEKKNNKEDKQDSAAQAVIKLRL